MAQKDLEPEEDAELTDLLHSFTGQLSEAAANKKSGTQFASYRVCLLVFEHLWLPGHRNQQLQK